jgi:hypothetical protein
MLELKSSDMARLISSRTTLNFDDWELVHQTRLGLLPLHGAPGYQPSDKSCQKCGRQLETTTHVLNAWPNNKPCMTLRHDVVLNRLNLTLTRARHTTRVKKCYDGTLLRPDLLITSVDPPVITDVTIPFDEPENLQSAHDEKMRKYSPLTTTIPFVVASLGSWLTSNDAIASTLGITSRSWNSTRRDTRLLAIKGSLAIARQHTRRPNQDPTIQAEQESQDQSPPS